MEKFYLFLNGIILLFLTTLPILILLIGIKSTIKMKGQNKPTWLIIAIAAINAIFFIISSLPSAYLLISKDVFGYSMILMILYYPLSVLVPCMVPVLLSYILIKKKINFIKAKSAYDSINYFNFCYGLRRHFYRLLL